ncbi:sulfotransferase family 2 domain-containing protein [Marinobacter sp. ATCH36]|uniref:sulfotransferase family 2 domain-containing protein n=1 Tax=Marinobacter sp. ATCH36 TaxID=2945106 RepID=UPI002021C9FE|nr:sulfotransferase family 2 domain-containing protein [Marinobacter sp. ATCH36]MCL7945691.1 sulfotransferase family protein [Marinobacter sp. ATCH36]
MFIYKSLKRFFISVYDPFPFRRYTKKYQCIYIHIPKSAGTSILTALQNGRPHRDHANIKDYYRRDPARSEDYFKFSFVRNPYDRIASVFFYLQRGGNGGSNDLEIKYDMLNRGIYNVNDFVNKFLDEEACLQYVLLRTQYSFFVDDKGEFKMDFVGKYENLEHDFLYVADKIGLPIRKLPKLNMSDNQPLPHMGYIHHFNDISLRKINALYLDDFEKFGYFKHHH